MSNNPNKLTKAEKVSFWTSIISALIVAVSSIYISVISSTNKIEYVQVESKNWSMEDAENYFPLKLGNVWEYEGTLTTTSNLGEEYVLPIKTKIKVVEETSNGEIKLFGLNNFFNEINPTDYYFLEKQKKIELEERLVGFLLIANEIYYVNPEQYEDTKYQIQKMGKIINQMQVTPELEDLELIIRMPLFTGQRFGDISSIARNDLAYFWYVNDEREITSTENNRISTLKIYELIYQELSSSSILSFRPNMGFLSYKFIHSTRGELNLELVSFDEA